MIVRRSAIALLALCASAAQAHHVMDYATPATVLDGFLSGIAHPVIGIDHLLFVIGAGVLAARVERGLALALLFVASSVLAVCLRVAGPQIPLGEVGVAASLVILGALTLATRSPGRGVIASLFLLAGALHGYALAEGIVGAETAPLGAYLGGLTLVLCLIASAAWALAAFSIRRQMALPLYRATGFVLSIAGLWFAVAAIG